MCVCVLTERPDGMVSPQVSPFHRRQVAVSQIRFRRWPVRRTERGVRFQMRVFPPPRVPDVSGPGSVHARLKQLGQWSSLNTARRENWYSCTGQ